jgi:CxxC-x17-CxxC domain-containing protein
MLHYGLGLVPRSARSACPAASSSSGHIVLPNRRYYLKWVTGLKGAKRAMSYADKTLACRDCGMEFVFTAGEQEFYAQKGFTNEPTRCPSCRQARKAGGRDSGGRDSYGGGYGGDRRGSGPRMQSQSREMHSVACASCGREAQVPFIPRGDKPVYCDDCFRQQRPRRF